MKTSNIILSITLLLVLFTGCRKEIDTDTSEVVGIPIEIQVIGDIVGDIRNNNGDPVSEVKA